MPIPKEKNTNSRRKRILWISCIVLDISLHKTSRIEILRHLAKRGCDVYLVAMRSKQRYQLKNSRIQTISIPFRNKPPISSALYGLTLLFFLPLYIARIRPDFVITESYEHFFSFIPTVLLFPFRRFKVVLDIRSTPVSRDTVGLRGYLKTFCFDVYVCVAKKLFDGITIITPLMKKEICKKFSIDPRFVGVWSSGASATLFSCEKYIHQGMKLRKKFGLLKKFIVFYHGALGPNRGLLETINAMSLTTREYSDIILFLLGNELAIDDLKAMIEKNEIQKNVIIHDAVDYLDVPKYIAMCDVGIVPLPNLPYWRHQCPLKLLEYLAMKKAVIVTDIPANREIVGNSKCGIYISSPNSVEIANSIVRAYQNREKLKKWGASGREIITKRYNWEKAAEDLWNYLLSLKNGSKSEG